MGGHSADVYYIRPVDRPLNKYLDAEVTWDHPLRIKPNSERTQIPMELPSYFICPSDRTPWVPSADGSDPLTEYDTNDSTWEWWGTSYAINWYWAYALFDTPPEAGHNADFLTQGVANGAVTRRLINSKNDRGSAEFVLFMENQFNYAAENAVPQHMADVAQVPRIYVGWHGQENMHAAAFLDGHAEYKYFDTRYVAGPGWTTWPNPEMWNAYWQPDRY